MPKEKKKSQKKGMPKKYIILSIIVIISLVAIGSLFSFPKEKLTVLEDRCGIVLGRLIHQIKDEPSCRIRCRGFCDTETKDFSRVQFVEENNQCNKCNCYCK